jgi:hypothetical protein
MAVAGGGMFMLTSGGTHAEPAPSASDPVSVFAWLAPRQGDVLEQETFRGGLTRRLMQDHRVSWLTQWPSDPAALPPDLQDDGLFVLFMDDPAADRQLLAAALDPGRVRALEAWVLRGGKLLVLADPRLGGAGVQPLLGRFGMALGRGIAGGKNWTFRDHTPVVAGLRWTTTRQGRLDILENPDAPPPILVMTDRSVPVNESGATDPDGAVMLLVQHGSGRVGVVAAERWLGDSRDEAVGNPGVLNALVTWLTQSNREN